METPVFGGNVRVSPYTREKYKLSLAYKARAKR